MFSVADLLISQAGSQPSVLCKGPEPVYVDVVLPALSLLPLLWQMRKKSWCLSQGTALQNTNPWLKSHQ